ncbi:DUF2125 domain-containing protein [Nguyenibacter vanlangensis]|uniref:DUF2125 domain-containing protein n=1 Tax=Nguyenibacter vanlangensis TaxID=1216886 RepID=A0ABZ3D537_9PROT
MIVPAPPALSRMARRIVQGCRARRLAVPWLTMSCLAVACLMLADLSAWWVAQCRLDAAVARWSADLARQGWQVRTGVRMRGGSPLTARIVLAGPALDGPIGGPAGRDRAAWAAERVVLSLSLLHPGQLRVGLDGAQVLRVTDPARPDAAWMLRGRGEAVRIMLPLAEMPGRSGWPGGMAAGHATWAARRLALRVTGPGGWSIGFGLAGLHGRGVWDEAAGPAASRLALALSVRQVWLPRELPFRRPLGWSVPPALPEAGMLRDGGLTLALAGDGRTLLVQDVHAAWSTLSVRLVGRLVGRCCLEWASLEWACLEQGLERDGADGDLTLSVAGIGRTVRALGRDGPVAPDLARAIDAIDRWAAGMPGVSRGDAHGDMWGDAGENRGEDGPAPSDRPVDLTLRLRGRQVFIGSVPVGWP